MKKYLILLMIMAMLVSQGLAESAEDAIYSFKKEMPNWNKYQLEYKLNMAQAMFDSDTSSSGMWAIVMAALKNQLLEHRQLTQQVRGLIESGITKGKVGQDGAVFVEGRDSDKGIEMLISCDELNTSQLEQFIRYQHNKP